MNIPELNFEEIKDSVIFDYSIENLVACIPKGKTQMVAHRDSWNGESSGENKRPLTVKEMFTIKIIRGF